MQACGSWRRCGNRGPALAPYHTNRFGAHTSTFRAPSAVGGSACDTTAGIHFALRQAAKHATIYTVPHVPLGVRSSPTRIGCNVHAHQHRSRFDKLNRMPDVSAGARPVRPVRLAACACVFDDACVSSGFRRHSAEWGEGPVQTVGMSCAREVPGKGHQHSLRDVGAQSLRGRAPPAATLWSVSARGTVGHLDRAALPSGGTCCGRKAKRLNRATERQDVGVSLPSGLRRAARAAADECDATLSTAQR
jgi:hypothetical protein